MHAETTRRDDLLIHFYRKICHQKSNGQNVRDNCQMRWALHNFFELLPIWHFLISLSGFDPKNVYFLLVLVMGSGTEKVRFFPWVQGFWLQKRNQKLDSGQVRVPFLMFGFSSGFRVFGYANTSLVGFLTRSLSGNTTTIQLMRFFLLRKSSTTIFFGWLSQIYYDSCVYLSSCYMACQKCLKKYYKKIIIKEENMNIFFIFDIVRSKC